MALCIACGSGIHEKEDCEYRDVAREFYRSGVEVSPRELREIEDAARHGARGNR